MFSKTAGGLRFGSMWKNPSPIYFRWKAYDGKFWSHTKEQNTDTYTNVGDSTWSKPCATWYEPSHQTWQSMIPFVCHSQKSETLERGSRLGGLEFGQGQWWCWWCWFGVRWGRMGWVGVGGETSMEGEWEQHRSHVLNDNRNGYYSECFAVSFLFFFKCFLYPEPKKK